MVDFTKIKWAGSDCILVTLRDNHNPRLPILLLDTHDINKLNREWKKKQKVYNV